jgi:hypothetical protein
MNHNEMLYFVPLCTSYLYDFYKRTHPTKELHNIRLLKNKEAAE